MWEKVNMFLSVGNESSDKIILSSPQTQVGNTMYKLVWGGRNWSLNSYLPMSTLLIFYFFVELKVDFGSCVSIRKKRCLSQVTSKLSEGRGSFYFSIAWMFSLYSCALLISPGKVIIKLGAQPLRSFCSDGLFCVEYCFIVFFADSLLYLNKFDSGMAVIVRIYCVFMLCSILFTIQSACLRTLFPYVVLGCSSPTPWESIFASTSF